MSKLPINGDVQAADTSESGTRWPALERVRKFKASALETLKALAGSRKADTATPVDLYTAHVTKLHEQEGTAYRGEIAHRYTKRLETGDLFKKKLSAAKRLQLAERLTDLEVLKLDPNDVDTVVMMMESNFTDGIHPDNFVSAPEETFIALVLSYDLGVEAARSMGMLDELVKQAGEGDRRTKRNARGILNTLQTSATTGGALAKYAASKRMRTQGGELAACDRDLEYITLRTGVEIDPIGDSATLVARKAGQLIAESSFLELANLTRSGDAIINPEGYKRLRADDSRLIQHLSRLIPEMDYDAYLRYEGLDSKNITPWERVKHLEGWFRHDVLGKDEGHFRIISDLLNNGDVTFKEMHRDIDSSTYAKVGIYLYNGNNRTTSRSNDFMIERDPEETVVKRVSGGESLASIEKYELPHSIYTTKVVSLALRIKLFKELLTGNDSTADANRLTEVIHWFDGTHMVRAIIELITEFEWRALYKVRDLSNYPPGEALAEAKKILSAER